MVSVGIVPLMLFAPEKAVLLNRSKATKTVGGNSLWVKEIYRSWSVVAFDMLFWVDIKVLNVAFTHGNPMAPLAGMP